jgi:hypothetical protein
MKRSMQVGGLDVATIVQFILYSHNLSPRVEIYSKESLCFDSHYTINNALILGLFIYLYLVYNTILLVSWLSDSSLTLQKSNIHSWWFVINSLHKQKELIFGSKYFLGFTFQSFRYFYFVKNRNSLMCRSARRFRAF